MIGGCMIDREFSFSIAQAELELLIKNELPAKLDERFGQPGAHKLGSFSGHKFVVTNAKPRDLLHPHRIEIQILDDWVNVAIYTQNQIGRNQQMMLWLAVGQVLSPILHSGQVSAAS